MKTQEDESKFRKMKINKVQKHFRKLSRATRGNQIDAIKRLLTCVH